MLKRFVATTITIIASIAIILVAFISESVHLMAQYETLNDSTFIIRAKEGSRKQLLIGKVQFGPSAEEIGEYRLEAALNFACLISGYYFLIPNSIRDSIGLSIQEKGGKPNIIDVAKQSYADELVFANINRIENMIRVDLTTVDINMQNLRKSGFGYGLIHYRNQVDNSPLYDPTLMEAVQRALAMLKGDSLMFNDAPGPYKIKPAPTLAIGGLYFRENKDLEKWNIFDKKVVNSYSIAEVMFDFSRRNGEFVTYDLATRDSIYAKFGLYGIENYMPPTVDEIEALAKLGVDYFMTGEIVRNEQGAIIKIDLCKIENNQLVVVKSVEDNIQNDSMTELSVKVKILTNQLVKSD